MCCCIQIKPITGNIDLNVYVNVIEQNEGKKNDFRTWRLHQLLMFRI